MGFGQDYLPRWDDERDEIEVRMVPYTPPASTTPAPAQGVDLARQVVMAELSEVLNVAYARQLTEKIVSQLAVAFGQSSPHKT